MNNGNSLILVVTPVFEDSVACGHLFSDLVNQYGEKLYIVAVDDGSIDQPLSIESLKSAGANGVLPIYVEILGIKSLAVGINHVENYD